MIKTALQTKMETKVISGLDKGIKRGFQTKKSMFKVDPLTKVTAGDKRR